MIQAVNVLQTRIYNIITTSFSSGMSTQFDIPSHCTYQNNFIGNNIISTVI